jgi:subtilisin
MEPIFRLPPFEVQAVTKALSETLDWSIGFLGIPAVWAQTEGEGVKVAVLDTGCDLDHPDLQGAVVGAMDFSGSLWGVRDRSSHGSWCAGMIGARANDIGVRGIVPKCQLLIGKVLGDDGSGSEQAILNGIKWAAAQGANIISMSLGGPRMSESLHTAIKAFVAKPHRFVICAAGNDGRENSVGYPAVWEETVAVAAVDRNGRLTSFSSRGPQVDIAAPGQDMLSTVPLSAGGYAKMSGTSMATPVVAGVAAACLSKHLKEGGLTGLETWQDLLAHLRKTAKDAGPQGPDTGYGYGIINPAKLLADIAPVTPPVTPTPEGPDVQVTAKDAKGQVWVSTKIDWRKAS